MKCSGHTFVTVNDCCADLWRGFGPVPRRVLGPVLRRVLGPVHEPEALSKAESVAMQDSLPAQARPAKSEQPERETQRSRCLRRRPPQWQYTLHLPPKFTPRLLGHELVMLRVKFDVQLRHDPNRKLLHVMGQNRDAIAAYRAIQMFAAWRQQDKGR